jgi:DnaJ family protein C protein 7
MEGISAEELKN